MTSPIVANGAPVRNQLLYILKSGSGPIKVGISYDPESRLRALMTGHPFRLEVAYVVEFEENLAASVEELTKAILCYCQKQGEWFDISVDGAIDAIKEARKVHEFCRKRIPPTIVERHVPYEVEVIVTPIKYANHERAFRVYLWLHRKIFETFFVIKYLMLFGAAFNTLYALGAAVDINKYGFFKFAIMALTVTYDNQYTIEFLSMVSFPVYTSMVVAAFVIDKRRRAELALRS